MLKRIAVVYDWIDKWGGVERVLLTLHEIFPQAKFFTSYTNLQTAHWARDLPRHTSFIQKLPNFIKSSRIFSILLYPYAFESFDFTGYDLVISVTSSFAKGVITKPETRHVCYLLTPTRFLWGMDNVHFPNKLLRNIAAPVIEKLRKWDFVAAQRPDKIISISAAVAQRCQKYYRRNSELLYPPFASEYWKTIQYQKSIRQLADKNQNYFLVVSRLENYKKIDLVISAFNRLPKEQLIIVGTGTQKQKLQSLAKKNISFRGQVSDQELASLYTHAKALIMPQEEDFGYVALEAQFFGCPVIAYARGGALETVKNGKTGIFFKEQTQAKLSETLARFHTLSYNLKNSTLKEGKENVERFSKDIFQEKFSKLIQINN